MKILIFSDLDGTFMNHNDYSYSHLKNFISKIKTKSDIIFTSSKTFTEMSKIYKNLNISFPFIVENGACIYFPRNYFNLKNVDQKIIEYKNFYCLKLSDYNLKQFKERIKQKFRKDFNFSFFSELSDQEIAQLTNLNFKNIADSKKRQFSDPIFWKDSNKNLLVFKKQLTKNKIIITEGGRFIHFNVGYDKGKAVAKFLEIYKKQEIKGVLSISLGDSENDKSMLELTDYSCCIKSPKKKKLYLKKSFNNYYSEKEAPFGWKESLEYVFKKENLNF